jgi:nucleotide-binding universal stress UspA family protein
VEPPFSDIVVPLDGSPLAERALVPALDLARRTGVPLRLLSRCFTDETAAVAAYLGGLAGRHAREAAIDTLVVDRDSIPDAIVDGLGPGSLVCMSSHGRGGVARAVVGSIAEALLRTLDRPALVVGPHATGRPFAGRVVACIDGSPASERTVGPAGLWAGLVGQPLWLLQVAEPLRGNGEDLPRDTVESAHLALLARSTRALGWDVVHDEDPARALVGITAETSPPTGLVVVASHGRTGWDRLRLGSVTAAVIHGATAPVLVVPAAADVAVGSPASAHAAPRWSPPA